MPRTRGHGDLAAKRKARKYRAWAKRQKAWEKSHAEAITQYEALESKKRRDAQEREIRNEVRMKTHERMNPKRRGVLLSAKQRAPIAKAINAGISRAYNLHDDWDDHAEQSTEEATQIATMLFYFTSVRELIVWYLTGVAPAWFKEEPAKNGCYYNKWNCAFEEYMHYSHNPYPTGANLMFTLDEYPELGEPLETLKLRLEKCKGHIKNTNVEYKRVSTLVDGCRNNNLDGFVASVAEFRDASKTPEADYLFALITESSKWHPTVDGDDDDGYGSDSEGGENIPFQTIRDAWWACDTTSLTGSLRKMWWGLDYTLQKFFHSQPLYTSAKATLEATYGSTDLPRNIPFMLRERLRRHMNLESRLHHMVRNYNLMHKTNTLLETMKLSIDDPSAFLDAWTEHLRLVNTYNMQQETSHDRDEEQMHYDDYVEHNDMISFYRAREIVPLATQKYIMSKREAYEVSKKCDIARREYEQSYNTLQKMATEINKYFGNEPTEGYERWEFPNDGIYPVKREIPTFAEVMAIPENDLY